jgi:uncharacterized membrane protein (UPF0127 family)
MDTSFLKKRNLHLFLGWTVVVGIIIYALTVFSGATPRSPGFAMTMLTIEKANGDRIAYKAELATEPEQQEYGLMYRRELAADRAMLFVYQHPQIITMWMKNTYIPLDMIFFDDNNRIVNIVTNAEPLNLKTLSSVVPALGVIEVNAGDVARHGIRLGDVVTHGQSQIID